MKLKHMHSVRVQIVRFIDAHFPGWVECTLTDAHGQPWIFMDKAPIFTAADLDAHSSYPQPGAINCAIIREWRDENGRARCIIDTERPHGIATKRGETKFEVFADSISPL